MGILHGGQTMTSLFEPLEFRTRLFALNRIVLAPLTNMQIINTTPPPPECAVNIPAGSGGSCVGGPRAYTVLVDKTAAGAKNYRIDVFCRNIFGAALATPVVITQDQ